MLVVERELWSTEWKIKRISISITYFNIRALYKTALSSHVPKHIKELSVSCILASLALGTRNEYRYIVNIFLIMNIYIEKKKVQQVQKV